MFIEKLFGFVFPSRVNGRHTSEVTWTLEHPEFTKTHRLSCNLEYHKKLFKNPTKPLKNLEHHQTLCKSPRKPSFHRLANPVFSFQTLFLSLNTCFFCLPPPQKKKKKKQTFAQTLPDPMVTNVSAFSSSPLRIGGHWQKKKHVFYRVLSGFYKGLNPCFLLLIGDFSKDFRRDVLLLFVVSVGVYCGFTRVFVRKSLTIRRNPLLKAQISKAGNKSFPSCRLCGV